MYALCLLGCPTFLCLLLMDALVSFLISSTVTWDFSIPALPPVSAPPPHAPLPLGLSPPRSAPAPRQPVSFSLMLQANRVEQSGQRRPRGRKTLEQSERFVGAPSPASRTSFQLSLPAGTGRWAQRQEVGGSLS